MRHPLRVLAISALAIGLAASGCSKNTGTGSSNNNQPQKKTPIVVDYKGDTPTPAPDVPGAKQGGTLTILQDGDFEHLAPQQIYVSNALEYSQLFYRSLTGYIEDPKGEQLKLVGDLATNAGVTTDGGKTWTYTLRDGIKFEDGTPITSKDVAYGIAVSFSDYGVQGPQYLQSALDPNRTYKGPYSGQLLPPGVTTPDDKTIVFTFPEAHPELPYLVAFPTATPIPQAKDTKANYETQWVSMGPYKRQDYKRDVSLTLVRNDQWDPNTDPIRHQYVDKIVFDFTSDAANQTNRLVAAQGTDANAIMTQNVDSSLITDVKGNADVMKRANTGPSPFDLYIYINTQRVTDVDVRRALNYAFNRDAYIKSVGGYDVSDPSTTLLAPVVPGYKKYDAYPGANGSQTGDVAKAKQLLQGKTVPNLKYCFGNSPAAQKTAAVIQGGLARAGFNIVLNPIDRSNYYTTVGDKTTTCDLMAGGWGQDYPDGDSTLGVLFDGTKIVAKGNNNLSYFNEPTINAKLKTLRENPDRSAVASQYGDLDEEIMTDYAPVIPTRYLRNFLIHGPNVGGTFISPLFAEYNITGIYVTG